MDFTDYFRQITKKSLATLTAVLVIASTLIMGDFSVYETVFPEVKAVTADPSVVCQVGGQFSLDINFDNTADPDVDFTIGLNGQESFIKVENIVMSGSVTLTPAQPVTNFGTVSIPPNSHTVSIPDLDTTFTAFGTAGPTTMTLSGGCFTELASGLNFTIILVGLGFEQVVVPVTINAAGPAVCGDGNVDAGEQCDDSNTTAGDGCSATCQNEICGDNIKNDGPPGGAGELCDGTDLDSQTCSSQTAGANPNGILSCNGSCNAFVTTSCGACGDGNTDGPQETCDDGNLVDDDGCSSSCLIESSGSRRTRFSSSDVNLNDGDDFLEPSFVFDDDDDFSQRICHDELIEKSFLKGSAQLEPGMIVDDENLASNDGKSDTGLMGFDDSFEGGDASFGENKAGFEVDSDDSGDGDNDLSDFTKNELLKNLSQHAGNSLNATTLQSFGDLQ